MNSPLAMECWYLLTAVQQCFTFERAGQAKLPCAPINQVGQTATAYKLLHFGSLAESGLVSVRSRALVCSVR
jgi:hypothetical protein